MRCMNCNRDIPDNAKVCEYCEQEVGPQLSDEEIEAAQQVLANLSPDVMSELTALMKESESAEDFANRIFVGDCPKCGSSDTGNCENDPEIGELLIGRCYQCGQLWCTECLKFIGTRYACECWEEDVPEWE